ncbi:MAG: hypothetical protein H6873_04865 [Hyphomicrobiaceae bacterium]|nr:hypothetical protein [Hyphomicrobiaceae bacterium]
MFADSAVKAVELVMTLGCVLMGVSHVARPRMWMDFFARLHEQGTSGVVIRTFALELWPALVIVALHQVWTWPGIVLTLFGCALTVKCTISMIFPEVGVRSLSLANRTPRSFTYGGAFLILVGAASGWAYLS